MTSAACVVVVWLTVGDVSIAGLSLWGENLLIDLMTSAACVVVVWMTPDDVSISVVLRATSIVTRPACFLQNLALFTVNFSGHFPFIPATVFHIRGSVGLLLKSSFILYRSWKLQVVQGEIAGRQKLIPVRVFVRAGRAAIPHSHLPAGIVATMRRVVNYHSSWARQQQVEWFDASGITDSACKNQSVVVSVQYGPFNPYIPIRSTTIGKSRVAIDPIAMHTSWRSKSDIASATRGEFLTTMHRLLHASGSHPIPTPYDPKRVGKRVKVRRLSCRVSMTFRVVRTNQYTKTSDLSTRQMKAYEVLYELRIRIHFQKC
ncbi:xyloglucan endotransglucosylase/hydrolase protein 2-like [Dorcoceras hygrometricum]|uniref:Xyloglucan endotransglucosylase/hydrolase protein 2-like n=1 Tax=Dorcoceras hygrometricum TaxID=472368 RepID=A0A2Z7ASU7_9LAMI|nr:xyloglucan endotransglucosylase/hydrolase protein 2-like [Dorcoceras hygrometricum]